MLDLDSYAAWMAEAFWDDPGTQAQFDGVPDGYRIFEMSCRCQLEAYEELGGVRTWDDRRGLVMGHWHSETGKLNALAEESTGWLLAHTPHEALASVGTNSAVVAEVARHDWYTQYCKEEEIYVWQVVLADKATRGSGLFREMTEYVLEKGKRARVPVVLQTFVKALVPKYEHMGFRLIETVGGEEGGLGCYNLMHP